MDYEEVCACGSKIIVRIFELSGSKGETFSFLNPSEVILKLRDEWREHHCKSGCDFTRFMGEN